MRWALLSGAAALVVTAGALMVPTASQTAQFGGAAATKTIVSLTFDDGSASQYSTLPMLQSRGMQGTYYINSAMVGSSSYYMKWPRSTSWAMPAMRSPGTHSTTPT